MTDRDIIIPLHQTGSRGQTPAVFQVVGYKKTGKTTMVCRLTELLKQAGFTVGTIKHDAHEFEMDKPATDTWLHQSAGADITAIVSSTRTAILKRNPDSLESLLQNMPNCDYVILEGFKQADYPKLIMLRREEDASLLLSSSNPLAYIIWPDIPVDGPLAEALNTSRQSSVPRFNRDDHHAILAFIQQSLACAHK
ncbi:molybdopterin-guanine dinucleotide biosynthesis protein B [Paenibacillus sp. CAU 1782]